MAMTIDRFLARLGGTESGGDYNATNASGSGAHGRYQIMPANWPSWAAEAGLSPDSAQTPENQEKVVRHKVQTLYDTYGNWADVAAIWYSGQPLNEDTADRPQTYNGDNYPSIRQYVSHVLGPEADEFDWAGAHPVTGSLDARRSGPRTGAGADPSIGSERSRQMTLQDGNLYEFWDTGEVFRLQKDGAGNPIIVNGQRQWVPETNRQIIAANPLKKTTSTTTTGPNIQIPPNATPSQKAKAVLDAYINYKPWEGLTDPAEIEDAIASWQSNIGDLTTTYKTLYSFENNLVLGPDGYIRIDLLPPEQQAAARAQNEEIYRKFLNDVGIDQHKLDTEAEQADFANRLTVFGKKQSIDKDNLDRAEARIRRAIDARQEARARADFVQSALMDAAKFAAPEGKTQFTGSDLGLGPILSNLGFNPNDNFLGYTGQMTVNPGDLMRQYDEMMGITGPIPDIPDSAIGFGDIPAAPAYRPAPTLNRPRDPNAGYRSPVPSYAGPPVNVVGTEVTVGGAGGGGAPGAPTRSSMNVPRQGVRTDGSIFDEDPNYPYDPYAMLRPSPNSALPPYTNTRVNRSGVITY